MNKVSESIWDNKKVIIPMAEVSHIERDQRKNWEGCISVIFKHSKWNPEIGCYDPTVFLPKEDAQQFISDWCYYRSEVGSIEECHTNLEIEQSKARQYNEYLSYGGTMTFADWEKDGRFDPSKK